MSESNIQEKIDGKYKIIEKIGSGGQANIFLVIKIGTNEEYAAKVFKENSDFIDNEINMLQEVKQYQCPYIINIIDSGEGEVIRKNRKTKERKYFILDNQPNGNLFDYILVKGQGVGELYSKIIFQKILFGIQCLHKHNICHRDLKLENIFLDGNFEPKIGDFGFASFNSDELICNGGTEEYLPPEAKGGAKYNGIKGDIFYLASVLMILTAGIPAFQFPNKSDSHFKRIYYKKYDLYWNKIEPKINQKGITISPDFKEFFNKIVAIEPNERLNIDEMLAHPWFKEINDMKKDNLEEFKKNEEKIKELFTELIPMVKRSLESELRKADANSVYAPYNRSISDNIGVFNPNAKPKIIDTPMNVKYCINIRGYLEPVSFMNKLCEMIKNEFEIECSIDTDPEILKMRINFEKSLEEENEEEDKEFEEEKKENEENNEEEDNTETEMEIKLYKDTEKYMLRFKEKKGNRKIFIDKYKIISDMAIKLLN